MNKPTNADYGLPEEIFGLKVVADFKALEAELQEIKARLWRANQPCAIAFGIEAPVSIMPIAPVEKPKARTFKKRKKK